MNPKIRTSTRKALRYAGLFFIILGTTLVLTVGGFWACDKLFPFPTDGLHPPHATMVLDRDDKPLRFFLAEDDRWRFPVEIEKVSPLFVQTLIASEDAHFFDHFGVDIFAIFRATWSNIRAGKIVSGASTIPMQVARLARPAPRTFLNKCREAFRAVQLWYHYDRQTILSMYLNLTPYGGNIVGVKSAAWFYFGKSPAELSLAESALLTALPRSPVRYHPFRNPVTARKAMQGVLRQVTPKLLESGVREQDIVSAKQAVLPMKKTPLPFTAPLFSLWAHKKALDTPILRTTIHTDTQLTAQTLLKEHLNRLRPQGVENGSVVIFNHLTGELISYVGTPDFFDRKHHGQINAANIKRAVGSTLKPFLYGQAIDKGKIPESFILDIPTDFSGYTPKNYDEKWYGKVTLREALRRSLNVPAVQTLAENGLEEFYTLLQNGGLQALDESAHFYGLPLALGSCEIPLYELTRLYTTLATGGKAPNTHWQKNTTSSNASQLLSPEATSMISEILKEVSRPDMPATWQLTKDFPSVAWKTGTSFGHRDAWAVGYSEALTIGVWVGNVTSEARKGISGSKFAGPLLFDLFRALKEYNRDSDIFSFNTNSAQRFSTQKKLNFKQQRVCKQSHKLPTIWCTETLNVKTIPGVTTLKRCSQHKRIFVDKKTGDRLYGNCLFSTPHQSKIIFTPLPELTAWRLENRISNPPTPPLSPLCTDVLDEKLTITSPAPNGVYKENKHMPPEFQKLQLKATAFPDSDILYWFVDGVFVGSTQIADQFFYHFTKGKHELTVTDTQARFGKISLTVH
ncbi:MAG: penicillin-binding protein 1C [Desulfovibrio sp.]